MALAAATTRRERHGNEADEGIYISAGCGNPPCYPCDVGGRGGSGVCMVAASRGAFGFSESPRAQTSRCLLGGCLGLIVKAELTSGVQEAILRYFRVCLINRACCPCCMVM